MDIVHWMRKEHSGLARSTLEIAEYEKKQGHRICIKEPSNDQPMFGTDFKKPDIHCIHSQLNMRTYKDNVPKVMWMHGEPLSSVGNNISMRAIVDLAPLCDCFICMRRQEMAVWSSIKRTFLVPKGIDLDVYKPMDGIVEKLSGEPCVLYYENWRGQRNPLYLCLAMQEVHKKYPNARLHLMNAQDQKMKEAFLKLAEYNKWSPFLRTIGGPVDGDAVNLLLNRVDIVVSCLFPLYARGIEAFGAGRGFICPGYREYPDYPYMCDLQPESMAKTIIKMWEEYGQFNFRQWAEKRHDVNESVKEAVKIYERYC